MLLWIVFISFEARRKNMYDALVASHSCTSE